MAVYLLTFHTYRSWRADDPRGYTKRGQGVLPPDPKRAQDYDEAAKHPPIRLDAHMQRIAITTALALAENESWRMHYVYAGPTHVHVLISWKAFIEWNKVRVKMKRHLGKAMSQAMNRPGPWFSRGSKDSRKRVTDRKHFDHLKTEYLPKRQHRGTHWREGCKEMWVVR